VSPLDLPNAQLPLRRIEEHPLEPANRAAWPATLGPVKQLLRDGLNLDPVTIHVGDNGGGKSTLVEAWTHPSGT
jgi:predicted ATPase